MGNYTILSNHPRTVIVFQRQLLPSENHQLRNYKKVFFFLKNYSKIVLFLEDEKCVEKYGFCGRFAYCLLTREHNQFEI